MTQMAKSAPFEEFGNIGELRNYNIGTGRFAAEHWIVSHPDR